jgi:hypothetical protein
MLVNDSEWNISWFTRKHVHANISFTQCINAFFLPSIPPSPLSNTRNISSQPLMVRQWFVTMLLGLQDLLCTEDVESLELVQSCVGSSIVDSNSGLNGCSTSSSFLDDDKEVFSRSIETESDNLIRSRYRSRLHSHSFEFLSRANSVAWILKVIFFGINCLLYWINFFRNMFYSLYISANKKIVQARAHHRFLPVTAYLAMNYMDRFLSLNRLSVWTLFTIIVFLFAMSCF